MAILGMLISMLFLSAVVIALQTLALMLCWNAFATAALSLPALGFWPVLGLLIGVRILWGWNRLKTQTEE